MIKKLTGSIVVVSAVLFVTFASSLWETNDAGYYQVKQAFITGDMSVRSTPGTYWQGMGDITRYKFSDVQYFSRHDNDGDDSLDDNPVTVTFNGNSKAEVSGVLKYRLPENEPQQLVLHSLYKSERGIKNELIRQYLAEVLIQTSPLMTAEEAYAPRRTEFRTIAEQQLIHGLFKKRTRTVEEIEITLNEDGKEVRQKKERKVTELVLDENGNPIVETVSPLKEYGIEVITFTLKDFDFDQKTEELIAKKKETEMLKILAETDAQKAQQDAIKAVAEGKARVAKAEADALVEKKTAIIQAEKEFHVAQLARKKAEEDAKADLVKREAEAKANALLVKAGLTPAEKANIDMQTAIGVAKEIAKLKLPSTYIGGGNSNGQSMNVFDAMGIKAAMDLVGTIKPSK